MNRAIERFDLDQSKLGEFAINEPQLTNREVGRYDTATSTNKTNDFR